MRKLLFFLIIFCVHATWGQNNEWHVRPYADNYTNPTGADGLSFQTAWCLQYALSGGGGAIQAGDTVWLHGDPQSSYIGTPSVNAIYKGHFNSTLVGDSDDYIKVSSFPGEWAVIDGNVHNNPETQTPQIGGNNEELILFVTGGYVRFENFEITCLGNFSRLKDFRTSADPSPNGIPTDPPPPRCNNYPIPSNIRPPFNFHEYVGIQHWAPNSGVAIRNEFRNLVIRNIPGVAFASWKHTLDTEIYGNVFFNNGIIEVIGFPCTTDFETFVGTGNNLYAGGSLVNTRGHQTSIYTQNASDVDRTIRNNIFMNCYDSGLNIWSASNASSVGYVNNYEVSKNIFINNGSPVPDETANMIISTNAGNAANTSSIKNINVDSNFFYKGWAVSAPQSQVGSGVAGIRVTGSEDVSITNNFLLNGSYGMDFSGESNHKIKFFRNVYSGRRMLVNTSIANFISNGDAMAWEMNHNTYFTVVGTGQMFRVPRFTPCVITPTQDCQWDDLWLNQVNSSPNFRSTYGGEMNSSRRLFSIPSSAPSSRTIINQNKYQPNKFTVVVYNPVRSTTTFDVNFEDYSIPDGTHYTIRDVQNYFNVIEDGEFANSSITLPSHDPNNFEMPLPQNDPLNVYGPPTVRNGGLVSPVVHSNIDFNTYIIEFDCSSVENLIVNQTDSSTHNYVAGNTITFGPDYTAEQTANVTAVAGNAITLTGNTWIKKNSLFWGRIGQGSCSIALNQELESAPYVTNRDSEYPPNQITSDDDPPYFESKIRVVTEEGTLQIYPNPNNGIFHIENRTSRIITKVLVIRIDSGKSVFSQEYNFQENIKVDISNERIGLFAAQIFFEDGNSETIKIIKK